MRGRPQKNTDVLVAQPNRLCYKRAACVSPALVISCWQESGIGVPSYRKKIFNVRPVRLGNRTYRVWGARPMWLGERPYRIWGVVARLGNLACWAVVRCSAKTFEFTRVICYDVSCAGKTYLFRLQRLQSDARVAADTFHGCRALLLLDRSAGR